MLNMMKSMFGISVAHEANLLRTFSAWMSWLCHFIGLCPMLMYYTPSGQLKKAV